MEITGQIDMIYLEILLYFGLYQNHLQFITKPFSVGGFDINRNIRKFLNKSCRFDQSFRFFGND